MLCTKQACDGDSELPLGDATDVFCLFVLGKSFLELQAFGEKGTAFCLLLNWIWGLFLAASILWLLWDVQ